MEFMEAEMIADDRSQWSIESLNTWEESMIIMLKSYIQNPNTESKDVVNLRNDMVSSSSNPDLIKGLFNRAGASD